MPDDVSLFVNGKQYRSWTNIRVTTSAISLAGSFILSVSDRWSGAGLQMPIVEEDLCRIQIGDDVVIEGHVDRRNASFTGRNRGLSFSGRDLSAVLMDCSVLLTKWSFRRVSVLDLARKVAGQFNVSVSLQDGLSLEKIDKLVVNYGDTAFAVIDRAAKQAGVMVVSDGVGGIELTRAIDERADPLTEGDNLLSGSADYDASDRYRRYVVATQSRGSDNSSGNATRIRAEATDDEVRRADRVLVVRPDTGMSKKEARHRGEWEARTRAARAESVEIVVRGWRQRSGALWVTNRLTKVKAPGLLGVNRDMRISEVVFLADDDDGKKTKLRLVRPGTFLSVNA